MLEDPRYLFALKVINYTNNSNNDMNITKDTLIKNSKSKLLYSATEHEISIHSQLQHKLIVFILLLLLFNRIICLYLVMMMRISIYY